MLQNFFELLTINHFMYALFRIAGMLMAAPIVGSQLIPARLRILLALLITIIIFPLLPVSGSWDAISLEGFIVTIEQILIGLAIGLVFQFVFQIIILGGQVLALQSGLGFATLVDPQSHENLPMISQFYLLSVTLLFLALDGHLTLIKMVVNSFYTIPIGTVGLASEDYMKLVYFAGNIFSGAVSIALPAIISLLMVNMTFAILTKSAPQINIFSIGFPLTLIFGLFIMYLSFPSMMDFSQLLFTNGFQELTEILGQR